MNFFIERTENADKKLLAERYQGSTVDAIDDCLDRAEGMAGLLIDVSALNNSGEISYANPQHIEHTAKALQMTIRDAIIMLHDLYQVCREEE